MINYALSLSKQFRMKEKKTGRKPIPKGDKVKILQLYAKIKNHAAIMAKFKPAIERFEKSLDKLNNQ